MKVVVGLGNPGIKYEQTRHNAGFWVIVRLAEALKVQVGREKWSALVGETVVNGEKVMLVEPLTFMNRSGESVAAILDYFPQVDAASDLIVIYDDLDLPPGMLRLRRQGSAGGHNGMKSIIAAVGHQNICRIRVGIGRPDRQPVIDYVLQRPDSDEQKRIDEAVELGKDAALLAINEDFEAAMNKFN